MKFDFEKLAKIETLRGGGDSQNEIAEKLGMSRSEVCAVLKQLKELTVAEFCDIQDLQGEKGFIDWQTGEILI